MANRFNGICKASHLSRAIFLQFDRSVNSAHCRHTYPGYLLFYVLAGSVVFVRPRSKDADPVAASRFSKSPPSVAARAPRDRSPT